MKEKYYLLLAVCCLLPVALLLGCGNGPGSPGSQGTENTGVMVDVQISPTYNGAATSNVDAFQDNCGGTFETYTDHAAQVTFTARLLNPNATFTPAQLHVEKYTIEFRRKDDSLGAPPIARFIGNQRVDIVPPSGSGTSSVSVTLLFVDLTRKERYVEDFCSSWDGTTCVSKGVYSSSSFFLNNYTATYTFEGQNDFGEHFSFTGQTDFSIGDFNNC